MSTKLMLHHTLMEISVNTAQMEISGNNAQKMKCFPLRISSVNVTKPAANCRFGHIY